MNSTKLPSSQKAVEVVESLTKRNWILQGSDADTEDSSGSSVLRFSLKKPFSSFLIQTPTNVSQTDGINSLNARIRNSYKDKSDDSTSMRIGNDESEIVSDESVQGILVGEESSEEKVEDAFPKFSIDGLQSARIRHLKWFLMTNRAPQLTASYRREGRKVVEESFQFIDSEMSDRFEDRRNSDTFVELVSRQDDLNTFGKGFTEEKRFFSDLDLTRLPETKEQELDIQLVLPETSQPKNHAKDMVTSRVNGEFLEYYDANGELYAVYAKRKLSDLGGSKRSHHVSFDDKIVYLESFAAELSKSRNRLFDAIYSEIQKPGQIGAEPYDSSRNSRQTRSRSEYAIVGTRDCLVCGRIFEKLYSRDDVSNMCPSCQLDNERVSGSDSILQSNPLFIDDSVENAGGLAPSAHFNYGYEADYDEVAYSETTTAPLALTGDLNGSVRFQEVAVVVGVGKGHPRRRRLNWSRSRKLCMAVLLMIFILALAGVGIGLTIYFD